MASSGIKNPQVLIVEDDADPRELHRESLEGAGFICFTACSGQAALEVFAVEQIDLAVVDVMMPEMSGPDLFVAVKAKYPSTAVVLVGGEDGMDVAVSQIKRGALDYLVKPVDEAKLIEAVNEALEKQGEYLDNLGHQQHLEELLVHQSKAVITSWPSSSSHSLRRSSISGSSSTTSILEASIVIILSLNPYGRFYVERLASVLSLEKRPR